MAALVLPAQTDMWESISTSSHRFVDHKLYLLVVIGELASEEQQKCAVADVHRGIQSWDTGFVDCDFDQELKLFVSRHSAKFSPHVQGEKTLHFKSNVLETVVLINPTVDAVSSEVRVMISDIARQKLLVLSGQYYKDTGGLILQSGSFSFHTFMEVFAHQEIGELLSTIHPNNRASLALFCPKEGDWKNSNLEKHSLQDFIDIKLNNDMVLPEMEGLTEFTEYLSASLEIPSPFDMLEPPASGGFLKLSKPCCYIFPGGRGDSALFSVNGFNMLVNGGSERKSCFWKLVRHLDRIDSVLLTHMGDDNLPGINSLLERKLAEEEGDPFTASDDRMNNLISPDLGVVFLNVPENLAELHPDPRVKGSVEDASLTLTYLNKLSIKPQALQRTAGNSLDPILLFEKMGVGRLEMYVLSPTKNSKELQFFMKHWSGSEKDKTPSDFPVPHLTSISSLLVWHPANPSDKIVRVLFSGNAAQQTILEGLEMIKHLDFLKQPTITQAEISSNRLLEQKQTKPKTAKESPKVSRPPASPKPRKASKDYMLEATKSDDRDSVQPKKSDIKEKLAKKQKVKPEVESETKMTSNETSDIAILEVEKGDKKLKAKREPKKEVKPKVDEKIKEETKKDLKKETKRDLKKDSPMKEAKREEKKDVRKIEKDMKKDARKPSKDMKKIIPASGDAKRPLQKPKAQRKDDPSRKDMGSPAKQKKGKASQIDSKSKKTKCDETLPPERSHMSSPEDLTKEFEKLPIPSPAINVADVFGAKEEEAKPDFKNPTEEFVSEEVLQSSAQPVFHYQQNFPEAQTEVDDQNNRIENYDVEIQQEVPFSPHQALTEHEESSGNFFPETEEATETEFIVTLKDEKGSEENDDIKSLSVITPPTVSAPQSPSALEERNEDSNNEYVLEGQPSFTKSATDIFNVITPMAFMCQDEMRPPSEFSVDREYNSSSPDSPKSDITQGQEYYPSAVTVSPPSLFEEDKSCNRSSIEMRVFKEQDKHTLDTSGLPLESIVDIPSAILNTEAPDNAEEAVISATSPLILDIQECQCLTLETSATQESLIISEGPEDKKEPIVRMSPTSISATVENVPSLLPSPPSLDSGSPSEGSLFEIKKSLSEISHFSSDGRQDDKKLSLPPSPPAPDFSDILAPLNSEQTSSESLVGFKIGTENLETILDNSVNDSKALSQPISKPTIDEALEQGSKGSLSDGIPSDKQVSPDNMDVAEETLFSHPISEGHMQKSVNDCKDLLLPISKSTIDEAQEQDTKESLSEGIPSDKQVSPDHMDIAEETFSTSPVSEGHIQKPLNYSEDQSPPISRPTFDEALEQGSKGSLSEGIPSDKQVSPDNMDIAEETFSTSPISEGHMQKPINYSEDLLLPISKPTIDEAQEQDTKESLSEGIPSDKQVSPDHMDIAEETFSTSPVSEGHIQKPINYSEDLLLHISKPITHEALEQESKESLSDGIPSDAQVSPDKMDIAEETFSSSPISEGDLQKTDSLVQFSELHRFDKEYPDPPVAECSPEKHTVTAPVEIKGNVMGMVDHSFFDMTETASPDKATAEVDKALFFKDADSAYSASDSPSDASETIPLYAAVQFGDQRIKPVDKHIEEVIPPCLDTLSESLTPGDDSFMQDKFSILPKLSPMKSQQSYDHVQSSGSLPQFNLHKNDCVETEKSPSPPKGASPSILPYSTTYHTTESVSVTMEANVIKPLTVSDYQENIIRSTAFSTLYEPGSAQGDDQEVVNMLESSQCDKLSSSPLLLTMEYKLPRADLSPTFMSTKPLEPFSHDVNLYVDSDSEPSSSEDKAPTPGHGDPPPVPSRDNVPKPPFPDVCMVDPEALAVDQRPSHKDETGKTMKKKTAKKPGPEKTTKTSSPKKKDSASSRHKAGEDKDAKNAANANTSKSAKATTDEKSSGPPSSITSSPVYLDLVYIPNHGNGKNVNTEFFNRVRSTYYVISGNDAGAEEPSKAVLNALLEGKSQWDTNMQVTLIPTHDTEVMKEWYQETHEKQQMLNLIVLASSSTVVMQDESFPACKIEL